MSLATISATFPALFPTPVRFAGFAIAYNVSTSIFGGTAPAIGSALIGATGVGTPTTNAALLNAGLFSQPTSGATNDNGAAASQLRAELTEKLEQMRKEQNAALATIAANTGRVAKKLDDVTTQSGGDAITTEARQAAA